MTTTTSADARTRFEAYESSWAAQRWPSWQATLSPRYRFSIDGLDVGGVAETLAWSRALFAAFPDYRQRIDRVLVDGDVVVVEAVAEGESEGGAVPAGTRLHFPYVKVLRFGPDGLRDDRQYHDGLAVARRIWPALGMAAS